MVPFLDPDRTTESEATPEPDPEMDRFFESLVWEEAEVVLTPPTGRLQPRPSATRPWERSPRR
jgi:hypothetical protein